MKKTIYIICQFCGKKFNRNLFIDFLVRNECCKECFSRGVRENPSMIGVEIIEKLKKE
jgi:hypothetical protein